MKIRTTKYIAKEGVTNVYRNKLMSLASVSIVTASLVIFGIFYLISINLNNTTAALKSQLEIEIFCEPQLDDIQTSKIEDSIKNDDKILEYTKITKQQAFDKAKELLGKDESVLEGIDESFLPVSFKIKLKNPQDNMEFVQQYKAMSGVEDVKFSQKTIDFISKISYWMRLICSILIVIFLVISMFIISNTIKLTVFARRREISIMKYIGATDWFIRWPFVIEGVIIGVIGALVAFVITSYGYNALETRINTDLTNIGQQLIKFVKINEVGIQIVGIYSLVGGVIGAAGSLISIRKYLRV